MNRSLSLSLSLLAAAALLAACDPPDVAPAADQTGETFGVIEGDLTALGPARGDAVLLLFRADAPPPPVGTGRPVNFLVVTQEQLFGDAAGDGPFSTRFQLPLVPPGTYTLRGFLDADRDWNPFFWITNLPTAGDVGGGYLEVATAAFAPIEVKAGEVAHAGAVFSSADPRAAMAWERPAFEVVEAPEIPADLAAPVRLTLRTRPIEGRYVSQDPERVRFVHRLADVNGDGVVDDDNGDGLPDTFPKVFLRRISDGDPLVDDPEDVLIPALVDAVPYLPALGALEDGREVPVTELSVIVPPVAIHSATRERIPLRPGRYAILVIPHTGQLWRVPNELAPGEDLLEGAPIADADAIASQGATFVVGEAAGGQPPGAIAGTVRLDPADAAPVVVLAFAASDPPPPAGTGSPRGVALLPAEALASGEASFRIGGLAAGPYLVAALHDRDRDFSPFVPALQGATAGDRSASAGPVEVADAEVSGVELDLRGAPEAPLERPAFEVPGGLTLPSDAGAYTAFTLKAAPSPHPLAPMDAERVRFTVGYRRGADGALLDEDGDTLPDLFPRVVLVKLDDADPTGRTEEAPRVAIPCAVNPLPWLPALEAAEAPFLLADEVEVLAAPAAVRFGEAGLPEVLPAIPPGRYGLAVINATGQTWRVPNDLGPALAIEPPVDLAREGFTVEVTEIPPERQYPATLTGTVTSTAEAGGTAYLLLFAESAPPPPEGTGRPVRAGRVAIPAGGGSVPYAIPRVPPGRYTLRALLDADASLHPAFDVTAGATLGDVGGGALGPDGLVVLDVGDEPLSADVTIAPALAVPTQRPQFRLDGGAQVVLPSDAALPGRFSISYEAAAFPGRPIEDAPAFVVVPQGGGFADADFDNLPDVFPKVLVARLDPEDPRGLRLASPAVAIPAAVDPLAALPLLGAGEPVFATSLEVALQPAAFEVAADGTRTRLPSIPEGDYAVVLVGATGQTWQLPNVLGTSQLAEVSQGLDPASETQDGLVSVGPPALEHPGAIEGVVTWAGAERGNVYVLAFLADDPPPPDGLGSPVAATGVPLPLQDLSGGTVRAPFAIRGLPPGRYTLRAFLDADRDFVSTVSVLAGPTAGDVAGLVPGVDVGFAPVSVGEVPLLQVVPLERPAFAVDEGATPATASQAAIPRDGLQPAGALKLDVAPLANAVVTNDPALLFFLVRFVDDDRDGLPDAQGGVPLLWPKVFLRQEGGSLAIPCLHDPTAYPGLFEGDGTPRMDAVLPAVSVTCAWLNAAIEPSTGAATIPPPTGRWSILVVNQTGQIWELPNELDPARFPPGSPLDTASQAVAFTIAP